MYYSDDVIEQVRSASDIVDVIGTYVHLTRRGSNYVGLCPFHNEKTGSFNVNKNMQIFKCFGCNKGGNVFTFLMEYDNLTFVEAVKTLADRAGITLPEREMSEADKAKRTLRERLHDVNKDAATYYYVMLRSPEGKFAYNYLKDRGLSDETMKNFGLGYAGKYANGLYEYLKSKNYPDDLLRASGLFSISEKGASDKFWNRVMFPIMDKNGRVIAFGGRIMGKAENAPKYLNSPETEVFLKGDNLYGLHLARHSHKTYYLLCEGYMDVIALHQAGFNNAVASLGTALTPRQARLISNYAKEVIITYDSDEAGQKAAMRAIPILKEAGITVKVLNMKPYKDPDEFIKALGAEAYAARIADALGGFFFEAETLRGRFDFSNPAEKTQFDHEIARMLARFTDELERNNYIAAVSEKYGIEKGALTRLVNRVGREIYAEEVAAETMEREKQQRKNVPTAQNADERVERETICYLANSRILFDAAKNMITGADFRLPLCNKLFSIIYSIYKENGDIVHASIIDRFSEASDQQEVAGILDPTLYEQNTDEKDRRRAFADHIIRLRMRTIEEEQQKAIAQNDGEALMNAMNREEELPKLFDAIMSFKN